MEERKRLSVLRNTSLNYLGQAYALLVGIVILPFYLSHLGPEAYGLIGFFAVMQAWLLLLDAGLSPSLVRQIAHFRGQGSKAGFDCGRLLRSFELIALPVVVLTALSVYLASDWIAGHWLQARELAPQQIAQCVALMGVMVALRLCATLYKSALQGLELHGWLNLANMLIATLRYFGGLALVAWISQDPLDFFLFQVAVAVAEALAFAAKAYREMPRPSLFTGFDWSIVRPVLPFAASMSLTTALWILLTQLDKVVLSNVLLLEEYGYFSLVALVSTGLITLINPLVQTLLPRLTMLTAEGRIAEMQALYLNATRFVCTFLFPLAAVIAFHAEDLVFAWTGDPQAAAWSAPILFWYALGSALLAVGGFQFYLQYAYGQLRLHLWFSIVSTAISVPLVLIAALGYGAYGAALCWFFLRLVAFLIWPAFVHRRLAPGIHGPWILDQVRISLMTVVGLLLGEPLFMAITAPDRFHILAGLAASGLLCLALVALSTRPLYLKLYVLINKPSL